MNISIDVPMLIAKAKQESGLTLGHMAKEMHVSQPRLSEWIKKQAEPSADQIAYLADKANLPILETIAALRPQWANIWKKAAESVSTL